MSKHSERTPIRIPRRHFLASFFLLGLFTCLALSPSAKSQTMQSPDITKVPTLYVVPYAHLDTQWRWEFPQTISEYLLKTMRVNFDYMDKYPHYVFNWTGSNRYRLMKEYFPKDYARIKTYVDKGQWFPAGSSVEEGDVNLPSAEGIFRQVLYGNTYFRHEYGKASNEYMLPDCFGFPASLPTILAHSGVKGFSTQKLNSGWQPAPKVGGPDSPEKTPEGIPFNVGVWYGPDGEKILAALNPGGYGSTTYTDLSKYTPAPAPPPALTAEQKAKMTPEQLRAHQRAENRAHGWEPNWESRIDLNGKVTGIFADYHYVGTGDIGGAAPEASIKLLEAIVSKGKATLTAEERGAVTGSPTEISVGNGPVHVMMTAADQLFNDIPADNVSKMPSYTGDLELINHSAGSLTSQAFHKRQVIRNENLADAAEKASIAAAWMGGRTYPMQRLNDAWILELSGHFHDSGAGTATPLSYEFLWNDDTIASNQFAEVLTSATSAITSAMNTQSKGTPVVVYNSLNIAREDMVEAKVDFHGATPKTVQVFDPTGKEVPAQIEDGKVLFVAKAPSVGYAVYDVVPSAKASKGSELKVTDSTIENAHYRVQVNKDGDISSIFDKDLSKELLASPLKLAISNDEPKQWPAWNMDFDQEQATPRAYVSGPAKIRISENGAARVAIEVSRETEGSKFVQSVSLAAGGAGDHVVVSNAIDWRGLSSNLKAAFSLSASNPNATYSWDIGTVQRPNASERQFEVGSHRWIDLTDKSGSYGATILTDCKNGSDKPADNQIRLTLLRSPGIAEKEGHKPGYSDQRNQDWGHHEFVYGVAGHSGDWRQDETTWKAYRLNTPLLVFESDKHIGTLGKTFSLLQVSDPNVRVLALKKAEDSDETVLRMVELNGKPASDVHVTFAGQVATAREINAQEQPLGDATVQSGALVTSFAGYQPRTFALKLSPSQVSLHAPSSQAVKLSYDLAVATNDDTKTVNGGMDGNGNAMPAEMLPSQISFNDVNFDLAEAGTGKANAVVAKGQTISLPQGNYNSVLILAASSDQDQKATFKVGSQSEELTIQAWNGYVGLWDTRSWSAPKIDDWSISANHAVWPPVHAKDPKQVHYPDDYVGLYAGFTKPASLAWFASHHHTADGLNQPYRYSYLFAYTMDIPAGAKTLTLPNNDKIRVLAVSVASENPHLKPAAPLYDMLGRTTAPTTMERAAH